MIHTHPFFKISPEYFLSRNSFGCCLPERTHLSRDFSETYNKDLFYSIKVSLSIGTTSAMLSDTKELNGVGETRLSRQLTLSEMLFRCNTHLHTQNVLFSGSLIRLHNLQVRSVADTHWFWKTNDPLAHLLSEHTVKLVTISPMYTLMHECQRADARTYSACHIIYMQMKTNAHTYKHMRKNKWLAHTCHYAATPLREAWWNMGGISTISQVIPDESPP